MYPTDRNFFQQPPATMRDLLCARTRLSAPIASEDISVVVQGPVFTQTFARAPKGLTHAVMAAIRAHLPDAQLIMATWQGQSVQNLDADAVLTLPDPGATEFYQQGFKAQNPFNNVNRLIASTQAGLAQAERPYTLKLRSDLLLKHAFFSGYFGQFSKYDPAFKVFKERVLAFPLYSLKYEVGRTIARERIRHPRPFHVSDWAYFGQSEDVRQLYACPLAPEPETSRWFDSHAKPGNDIWPERVWRYSPEQYITADLARRALGLQLAHASDEAMMLDSARFIANNFVMLDQYQWGIWSMKLGTYQDEVPDFVKQGMYSHANWLQDYWYYCVA